MESSCPLSAVRCTTHMRVKVAYRQPHAKGYKAAEFLLWQPSTVSVYAWIMQGGSNGQLRWGWSVSVNSRTLPRPTGPGDVAHESIPMPFLVSIAARPAQFGCGARPTKIVGSTQPSSS
eukprot:gene21389-25798_t